MTLAGTPPAMTPPLFRIERSADRARAPVVSLPCMSGCGSAAEAGFAGRLVRHAFEDKPSCGIPGPHTRGACRHPAVAYTCGKPGPLNVVIPAHTSP